MTRCLPRTSAGWPFLSQVDVSERVARTTAFVVRVFSSSPVRYRIHRRANTVPVVGEKDPSGQAKRVQCPRSVEGSRQQGEVRLGEFLSPPEQAHDDKESGKKRTPEFRHRERIRHGGNNRYGEDADRKIGGPRYLLSVTSSRGVVVTRKWPNRRCPTSKSASVGLNPGGDRTVSTDRLSRSTKRRHLCLR